MSRHMNHKSKHAISKKERLEKKKKDREAVIKLITGIILMFSLISWGANIFALTIPFIVGLSLIPNYGDAKAKWNSMGKKQKGIFVLLMLIFAPLILVGLMWVALIGSMFIIDMLVFLPIFLISSWFFFRKRHTNSPITKFLGSQWSLALGIIILGVIMALASYNYYEYEYNKNLSTKPVHKEIKPIIDVSKIGVKHGNHTYEVQLVNSGNGKNSSSSQSSGLSTIGTGQILNPNNPTQVLKNVTVNTTKTVNLVIFVRDVLTPEWLGRLTSSGSEIQKALLYERTLEKYNIMNKTDYNEAVKNKTFYYQKLLENLSINQSGDPIVHAQVSLKGLAKKGNDYGVSTNNTLSVVRYTDKDGIVIFNNVSEGFYYLDVDALGYRPYSILFPVAEETTKKPFVVLLVPDYYKVRVHWEININSNFHNYILWENFNESLSSNTTYISLYQGTPLSDADIIKTGFKIEKDLWYDNLNRIQSMYGWLGVNNPNMPFYGLEEQMLFSQNLIYTQSMYINPTNPQNIYEHQKHFIQLIIIGVIIVVSYLIVHSTLSEKSYIKIKDVKITLKADAEGSVNAKEGYNPTIYIMTPAGYSGTQQRMYNYGYNIGNNSGNSTHITSTPAGEIKPFLLNTGEVPIYIDIPEKPTTIGTPTSDYYLNYDGKSLSGAFTVIIWGKDIPSDDTTIILYASMQIHYTVYTRHGDNFTPNPTITQKNKMLSSGLEDTLKIRIATNSWGE